MTRLWNPEVAAERLLTLCRCILPEIPVPSSIQTAPAARLPFCRIGGSHEHIQMHPAANAGWIIGGKVCLALIHLGVSMCAARLLGTAGFGEIQYAAAISGCSFPCAPLDFMMCWSRSWCSCPKNSGAALGTAIGMRLAASLGRAGPPGISSYAWALPALPFLPLPCCTA